MGAASANPSFLPLLRLRPWDWGPLQHRAAANGHSPVLLAVHCLPERSSPLSVRSKTHDEERTWQKQKIPNSAAVQGLAIPTRRSRRRWTLNGSPCLIGHPRRRRTSTPNRPPGRGPPHRLQRTRLRQATIAIPHIIQGGYRRTSLLIVTENLSRATLGAEPVERRCRDG